MFVHQFSIPFASNYILHFSSLEPKIMNVENMSPVVQKPDNIVVETAKSDDPIPVENRKTECEERKEGIQAPPDPVKAPIPNKPAKRRITPMAIDP